MIMICLLFFPLGVGNPARSAVLESMEWNLEPVLFQVVSTITRNSSNNITYLYLLNYGAEEYFVRAIIEILLTLHRDLQWLLLTV